MKRIKPNPNNVEDLVRTLFLNNPETLYSLSDVLDALSISKKAVNALKSMFFELIDSDFIRRDNNKYRLNKPKPKLRNEDRITKVNIPIQQDSPNLIEGTFDATSLARNYSYAFVRTEKGDFYVSSEDTLNAFHGDTIAIEPHFKNGKSDYCYVRKIIKRANALLAGDLQQSSGKYYFICSNPKIHQWFDVKETLNATTGMKVMLEVTNWGNRSLSKPPVGNVKEVLGIAGNPETELMAVIRQNSLPLEFPESLTSEIDALPESIPDSEISKRRDFRNIITFTIDPSSAKDYDDAISLETTNTGWRLYVHIADVAHYIKVESGLFAECLNRGNSYYFPRKVIPMLPEKLSNRICSLRQNEDKLTLTAVTEFDKTGKILKQHLYESIINSNARLSYEQVDELFEGKPVEISADVIEALQSSRILSKLLTAQRVRAGYLFFDLPETEYVYNEAGFVHQMNQSVETESHKLIENFMLVANQFVAEQLTTMAPVVMYRVHELPDMEKLERLGLLLSAYGISLKYKETLNKSMQSLLASFPDDTYHRVFDRLVLRSLKKAKYTVEHLPHFGLAIETYTHFTSPIRRLCDLVVHHLCKKFVIHSSNTDFNKKQMITYSTIASDKELIADESEREIEKVMNAIYMKEHIGEVYEGIITGMNSSGMFVQLNDIPISGVLKITQLPKGKWNYYDTYMRYMNDRTGDFFQLMDTVKVQVIAVSDDVYFDYINEQDSHKHHVSALTPNTSFQKRKSNNKQKGHYSQQKRRKRV